MFNMYHCDAFQSTATRAISVAEQVRVRCFGKRGKHTRWHKHRACERFEALLQRQQFLGHSPRFWGPVVGQMSGGDVREQPWATTGRAESYNTAPRDPASLRRFHLLADNERRRLLTNRGGNRRGSRRARRATVSLRRVCARKLEYPCDISL